MACLKLSVLIVGAVLLFASSCGSGGAGGSICDTIYGNTPGYQLCETRLESCLFYRNNQQGLGQSCDVICGGPDVCLAAYEERSDGECVIAPVDPELSCDEMAHDSICECGFE